MYEQWQNNLQIRETDLIKHRVLTHSLGMQTEKSTPAFSKHLRTYEGNLYKKDLPRKEKKVQLETKVLYYQ